jgi:hypothetical protein
MGFMTHLPIARGQVLRGAAYRPLLAAVAFGLGVLPIGGGEDPVVVGPCLLQFPVDLGLARAPQEPLRPGREILRCQFLLVAFERMILRLAVGLGFLPEPRAAAGGSSRPRS